MKTRIIALFAGLLACLPMTSTWAGGGSTTYDYSATFTTSVASGAGKVYAGTTESAAKACTETEASSSTSGSSAKSMSYDFYGYAVADDGYEFANWTDGKTDNPRKVTVSLSSSSTTGSASLAANFKELVLDAFSVTFAPVANGCYSVGGTEITTEVVQGPSTKAIKVSLSATPATGYRVFGWWTKDSAGNKTYFEYAKSNVEKSFAKSVTVGVDFVQGDFASLKADGPAGFATLAEAMAAAASGETVLAFADAEIAEAETLTVPAGVTLNLTEGVKLAAYGNLEIKGQVVGDGKIVKNCMIVSQEAEIRNPYGSIKYQVTKAEQAAESVSGTPSCGIAYAVTVKRGGVVIARSAPSAFQPKAMVCTVDPAESLNYITACNSVHDTFPAAVNAHSSRNADQNPAKIVVMLADGTVALADVPDLEQIKSGKRQGKVSCGFRVDCAGFSPKVTFTSTNASKEYYINAKSAQHTSETNNSTDYYINCASVSAKLNINGANYSSRAEIYDCGTVSCTPSGSYDIVGNGGGLYFFSGGPYSNSFGANIRVYGGTFTHDPTNYRANPDLYVVKLEANLWQVTDEKPAVQAFEVGGKTYVTLADAIANAANGARIVMKDNYELTDDIVISAGKTVEIDLSGLKITGSGKVTNNGTFIVGDGSYYETGKGTFEPAIVNNGVLSICYGNYTGAITLNAGSSIVTRAGTFTGDIAVNEGATVDFRGGKFASSMAAYLADGYREHLSGGLYCVGEIFEADVKDAKLSGSERAYRLSAINFADAADYQLSEVRGDKDYADDEDGTLWYRHAELKSAIDPYSSWVVDCAVSFDQAVVADSVNFTYVMSKTLDKDLTAGEVYRCMSPIIASFGYTQISYGRFVAGDPATSVTVGLNNVAGHDENLGTVCTIEMRIYESSKNDDVYLTLARRRVTLGAYDNKAMIRGADGAVTFYPTLADAVAAVGKGGVIELAADCNENVTVNTSCAIVANGFAFGGTVAAREGWGSVSENEGVWTVEIADPAARVDETEFKTVAEAFAVCAEGAEIVLLRDCAEELKDVAKVCSFRMNGFKFVENGGVAVEVGYKIAYDKAKATWFVTLAEVQVEPPKADEIKPEVTEETEVRDESGAKVEVTPEVKEAAEKAVEKAAEETVAEVKAILTTTEVIDLKETGIEAAVKESKTQVKDSIIEVLKEAVVEKAKTDAKVEEKANEAKKALDNQAIEVSGFVNVKLTETEMKITKTEEATVAKVVAMRFDVTPKVQIKVNDVAVEAVVPPEEIKEKIRFRLPLTVAFSVSAKVIHHAAGGDVDMGLYPVRNEDGVLFVEVENDSFSPYDVIQNGAKIMVGDQSFDDLAAAITAAGGDLTKIVIYDGTLEAPADYRLVANEDGTWSVVAKHYVAQVGDEKFETLSEAVTAASRNGTVAILDDIELAGKIGIDKNLTFALGDKTISVTDGKGGIRISGGAMLGVTATGEGGIAVGAVTAPASVTDANGQRLYFGSLADFAAYAQKIRRLGDGSLDGTTVKVEDWHADYPKAWFKIDDADSISKNITDVSYTFYAYNPDVNPSVQASDWDICNGLVEDPTPAQIARRDEIEAEIEPFKNFGWHADFEVYFDKPVAEGSVSLSGYYASWLDGTVLTYDLDKDLVANQHYRLLKDKAGILYSYREILEEVKKFGCGVKNKSAANAGVKMTVELRLYYGTSGHVEDVEVPSLLMGSYEYVLKGPEIVMSIGDEVQALLNAPGLDEETKKRYEEKIVANEAVNGFKQTGIEASIAQADRDAGAYGYFAAKLTDVMPDEEADVLTEMAFDVAAIKVQDGGESPLTITQQAMLRLPVDPATSLTTAKVYCDGVFLGYYPVHAITISTQQPLEDPTKKPEGKEDVPWEELSPVDQMLYTFVEFPASTFPATYSYKLVDSTKPYDIIYMDGEVQLDGLSPDSYCEAATNIALPKLTSVVKDGYTFGGWVLEGDVVGAIPAGTSGDLTLTAEWVKLYERTGEINVKPSEGAKPALPIKVSEDWVEKNVEGGAGATVEAIQEVLNQKAANGNLKWQNYVLGLSNKEINAKVKAEAEQAVEDEVVTIKSNLAPRIGTGYEVRYLLDNVEKDRTEPVTVDQGESNRLNIPLNNEKLQADNVAYFLLKTEIVPEEDPEKAVKVEAENVVGVMKVTSDLVKTIIPVPWGEIGGSNDAPIKVSELVKVSLLTPGDMLYVYTTDVENYDSWRLTESYTWQRVRVFTQRGDGGTEEAEGQEATDVTLRRGEGVWIGRQHPEEPIYLTGQYNPGAENVTTVKPNEHNLVASPLAEEVDLNKVLPVEQHEGNKVFVPTAGAPIVYEVKAINGEKQWVRDGEQEVTLGGRTIKMRVQKPAGKLPMGQGFWFVDRKGTVEINWDLNAK